MFCLKTNLFLLVRLISQFFFLVKVKFRLIKLQNLAIFHRLIIIRDIFILKRVPEMQN